MSKTIIDLAAATPRPQVLLSVQALRGAAALLVLIFHLVSFNLATEPDVLKPLFSNPILWDRGFVGVDMFFVISGFIMVYITQNFQRSRRNIGKFLYSRTTRIYPTWWIFAAIAAAYAYLQNGAFIAPEELKTGGSQLGYLVKSFLLIPQQAEIVLKLGWTLIHEMYFYFMFALLLCLPRKFMVPAFGIWAAMIFFFAGFVAPEEFVSSFTTLVTSPLTLEFLFGALAALLIIEGKLSNAKLIGFIGLAAFVFFLIYDFGFLSLQPVWGKVILFGIPSALIVYGIVGAEITGGFKTPALGKALGDWSYSLYLSHLFVMSALGKIFAKLSGILPDGLNMFFDLQSGAYLAKFSFVIAVILASVIFSALCYRFIEKPLIGVSKKLWRW